jgi:folate-dependent phosphoribosylglycinamide formyltransferase PurN
VTVHLVDVGIDTGRILAQVARPFPEPATATAVRSALAPIERQLLCEVVQGLARDA